MMSRVCQPDQLFIMEELAEENITVHADVQTECKRMDRVSLNSNPDRWNNMTIEGLRVSSLNVRSLRKHSEDLWLDPILQKSDIVCVQETWLEDHECEDERYIPEGFVGLFCCEGRGKGVAIFVRRNIFGSNCSASSHATPNFQMMKLEMPTLDIINIYRSTYERLDEVRRTLENVIEKKPTIIVGDFNFCYLKKKNYLSQWLEDVGFDQVVVRATHIGGGLLDQAYLNLPEETPVIVGKYSNYFTDHDTIALLLPEVPNQSGILTPSTQLSPPDPVQVRSLPSDSCELSAQEGVVISQESTSYQAMMESEVQCRLCSTEHMNVRTDNPEFWTCDLCSVPRCRSCNSEIWDLDNPVCDSCGNSH